MALTFSKDPKLLKISCKIPVNFFPNGCAISTLLINFFIISKSDPDLLSSTGVKAGTCRSTEISVSS